MFSLLICETWGLIGTYFSLSLGTVEFSDYYCDLPKNVK
jgi:hypothetical protein